MSRHVLVRARRAVVTGCQRPASVEITDGRIVTVTGFDDPVPEGAEVVTIDDDCVLIPGLVDSHVHINEPGRTSWEGFATATAAALCGGVTTVADMPLNSIPATVDVAALQAKKNSTAGKLAVDVAFWGGAIPGNTADLKQLHDAGVVGFKCFLLPSGVDEFPPLDPVGLSEAMAAIAAFDGLLIAHAEDPAVIDSAPAAHGVHYSNFLASRPDRAEVDAVQLLLDTTARTGCRTHIVHLSSASSLSLVAQAKASGLPVTAETCPHYLSLTAESVPDGATQFKCCPPIRDAGNQDALWQGLIDGTIDQVVSDHSPCPVADKRLDTGDFGDAWGGISSVQLALPVVWTAAAGRGIDLADVVTWMAERPARLIRRADRGRIEAGRQADLVVFAPDEEFTVDVTALQHRNPLTPYADSRLRGVVRQTWLRGEPVTPDHRAGRMLSGAWLS